MHTKKKGLKVLFIVLAVVVSIMAGGFLYLMLGQDLKDAQIKNIRIADVNDGIYTGELTGSRFGNTLEATVREGRLVDIRILEDMVITVPELSSQVFDQVKAGQSLQIDAVAGATVSTKAYLKALERALDGKQTSR